MINTAAILARVDLIALVERDVKLKKSGSEWVGCCPFHSENSPSFYVNAAKGFVHCFGCGAHYDAIGYTMAMYGEDFVTACRKLGGQEIGEWTRTALKAVPRRVQDKPIELWVPVYPVPEDAPRFAAGERGQVWNPKREPKAPGGTPGGWWTVEPVRADAYLDADGALMGYVLRLMLDGNKITPTVTWCIGPHGEARWCLQSFPAPRPLCGLDALAARPNAPVLVVEGEKCRYVGAGALPPYVVVSWPGGSKGVKYTDWSPLAGRDLVLWPDADDGGVGAMLGYVDGSGLLHEGVAQLATRAGCRSIRTVDVSVQPKGWDIADAIEQGWTAKQLAAWARARVRPVEVRQVEGVVA